MYYIMSLLLFRVKKREKRVRKEWFCEILRGNFCNLRRIVKLSLQLRGFPHLGVFHINPMFCGVFVVAICFVIDNN